jgi:hypothetical protein
MPNELAVPLMAVLLAVVIAGVDNDATMPVYMSLGGFALIVAILLHNGSLTLEQAQLHAFMVGGIAIALFGHVRYRGRS